MFGNRHASGVPGTKNKQMKNKNNGSKQLPVLHINPSIVEKFNEEEMVVLDGGMMQKSDTTSAPNYVACYSNFSKCNTSCK